MTALTLKYEQLPHPTRFKDFAREDADELTTDKSARIPRANSPEAWRAIWSAQTGEYSFNSASEQSAGIVDITQAPPWHSLAELLSEFRNLYAATTALTRDIDAANSIIATLSNVGTGDFVEFTTSSLRELKGAQPFQVGALKGLEYWPINIPALPQLSNSENLPVLFGSSLWDFSTKGTPRSPAWPSEAIAQRVGRLVSIAHEECLQAPSELSLKGLAQFLASSFVKEDPKIFLLENGNVRALWRDGDEQIGLEFVDENAIRYVTFNKRSGGIARSVGNEFQATILKHLQGADLLHLLDAKGR